MSSFAITTGIVFSELLIVVAVVIAGSLSFKRRRRGQAPTTVHRVIFQPSARAFIAILGLGLVVPLVTNYHSVGTYIVLSALGLFFVVLLIASK